MALTDENGGIGATMLVSPTGNMNMPYPYPVYPQGGGNQGGFGNGQDGWWIVLLIILLAAGNGFGNNNGGGGAFGGQPIIVNDGGNGGAVQRGFDQAAVMAGITGVQSGVQNLSTQLCNCCGDIQQSLCNGFAGVNATVNGGFANAETAANARQIANMQQAFNAQTAVTSGLTNLSSQFADCCCENRLATERLNYTIATENCADRYEAAQNTRDIIENANRNNQAVLDKLCQLELDAKQDKINDLERQLTFANLQASQVGQTSQIVDNIYNRLSTCPVGTVPVYGEQPIFTCPNNNGCGCGCGNF